MFILELFAGIIMLSGGFFGGMFLWKDSKSDFKQIRALGDRVVAMLPFLNEELTDAQRAQKLVQEHSKRVDALRHHVASLQATRKQLQQRAAEQKNLAEESMMVVVEALKGNNESVAASSAVNHEQCIVRAALFEEGAKKQEQAIAVLRQQLDIAEMGLEMLRTDVETIVIREGIATANQVAYNCISDINAEGLTERGEVKQLLHKTEHAQFASNALISMVREKNGDMTQSFLRDAKVKHIIEEARNKIGLPAPSPDAPAGAGIMVSVERNGSPTRSAGYRG